LARSRRLIEKARGQGIFRPESGGEHSVAYTLEVRQEVVDGLPGMNEIEGYVTLPAAVAWKSRQGAVLELKGGRTTEVVLMLAEKPKGKEAKVKFRGGPLRRAGHA
jgi:hypothetical protein